jgi:hypothetical protein
MSFECYCTDCFPNEVNVEDRNEKRRDKFLCRIDYGLLKLMGLKKYFYRSGAGNFYCILKESRDEDMIDDDLMDELIRSAENEFKNDSEFKEFKD